MYIFMAQRLTFIRRICFFFFLRISRDIESCLWKGYRSGAGPERLKREHFQIGR